MALICPACPWTICLLSGVLIWHLKDRAGFKKTEKNWNISSVAKTTVNPSKFMLGLLKDLDYITSALHSFFFFFLFQMGIIKYASRFFCLVCWLFFVLFCFGGLPKIIKIIWYLIMSFSVQSWTGFRKEVYNNTASFLVHLERQKVVNPITTYEHKLSAGLSSRSSFSERVRADKGWQWSSHLVSSALH